MSKYNVTYTTLFKKDIKLAQKRGYDIALLKEIITLLAEDKALPDKSKDHALTGNFKGFRECHIKPDWLLIYQKVEEKLILVLTRTGSHSDLFR